MALIDDIRDMQKNRDTFRCVQVRRQDTDGSYEVHEYLTPQNEVGWTLFEYKTEDDTKYYRARHEGPETHRGTPDWIELPEQSRAR